MASETPSRGRHVRPCIFKNNTKEKAKVKTKKVKKKVECDDYELVARPAVERETCFYGFVLVQIMYVK